MNIHAELHGAAPSLSHADIAKLQAWFSPSFPIGSFSYSHGLEWVVETDAVRDALALARWIEGILRYGAGRSDAIILGALWRAVHAANWREAAEVSSLAAALQPTFERRIETLGQGSAFLSAVTAGWPHHLIERYREYYVDDVTYPVAVGVATAAHGVPLHAVLVTCLHAFIANLVSAGVRLVPLGQTEGLRVIAALEPAVLEVARDAFSAKLDELGSASFLADIASMCHETQYTRLFRS